MRPAQHVAARQVDVVRERDRDRHRRVGLVDRAVRGLDRRDRRLEAARQRADRVAGLEHAGRDRARVAAVVDDLERLRADDVLDREADVDEVAVARDVEMLELAEQRRALVPGRVLGADHDVVAEQRRDRQEGHVPDAEPGRERLELEPDLLEPVLGEVDQVHLVDADDEVRDPEQRGQERVPPALLGDAAPGVEQDQGHVGGRGAGDHVARVLDVPRGVRDDELAPRGGEVAVGDVDRDALLALGAEAVSQQREVGVVVAPVAADLLHGRQLVGEQRLRVVQQPADEGALAVVDRPGGREPEQLARHQQLLLGCAQVAAAEGGCEHGSERTSRRA